jgi:hypothetical protein
MPEIQCSKCSEPIAFTGNSLCWHHYAEWVRGLLAKYPPPVNRSEIEVAEICGNSARVLLEQRNEKIAELIGK